MILTDGWMGLRGREEMFYRGCGGGGRVVLRDGVHGVVGRERWR